MLSSALLLSFIAFGLSEINLIDYKVMNQNYLKKNIQYNYNLDLPESICYEKLFRRSLIKNIYMVESKSGEVSSEPIIVVDNEKIAIEKVHEKILDWQLEGIEREVPVWIYRLHIHKAIKMKFVKQLINELMESGVSSVVYAVIPAKHEYDKRYYQDYSFSVNLPNLNNSKGKNNRFDKTQNSINFRQSESVCFIIDSLILSNQIKYTIKKFIQQNPDYIINFPVDDNSGFSDYFRVLSDTKEAVNELRDEYAVKNYNKKFNSLNDEEEIEVSQRFPFYIFEFQGKTGEVIENE